MLKFVFYIALGGIAAFYIAKWAGYTSFSQVERDVRSVGKTVSRAADDVSDAAGDAAKEVKEEVK